MSFEVFMNRYVDGAAAGFARRDFEAAFGAALQPMPAPSGGEPSADCYRVEYPAVPPADMPRTMTIDGREYPVECRDTSELYVSATPDDASCITGFMVSGPAAHRDFWAAILRLLQITGMALFWPGENALVVGTPDTVAHLDPDMIETLGTPFIATRPEQIVERIRAS